MGNYDSFLASFTSNGIRLGASYFGGSEGEWAYSVATDASGNVYMPGFTYSTSGITSGGFQNTYGGGTYDGFLVKFSSSALVSLEENENQISINIFPNPFSTETTLQINENLNDATLMIYNILGQIVIMTGNLNGNEVKLFRDNLQKGIYFLRLTQGNRIITTEKIIIAD